MHNRAQIKHDFKSSAKKYLSDYFELTCTLNHFKIKSLSFNLLTIGISYLILLSTLISDTTLLNTNNSVDNLIIQIIYYSNLYHIFLDGLQLDVQIVLIIFLTLHLLLIILNILLTIYKSDFSDSRTLRILRKISAVIQQIYIWLFFLPFMEAYLDFLITDFSQLVLTIFIPVCLIIVLFYVSLIQSSQFDLTFIPSNIMSCRLSKSVDTHIWGQGIIILTRSIHTSSNLDSFEWVVFIENLILGLALVWQYYKELTFTHKTVSKFFATCNVIYVYMVCVLSVYQLGGVDFQLWVFVSIGLILLVPMSITIRSMITTRIMLTTDFNTLSNDYFDYFMRKILTSLKAPLHNKKKATFLLTVFIRSHVYNCSNVSCFCKSPDLAADETVPSTKLFAKSETMVVYKEFILQLINLAFLKKIETSKRSNATELDILYMLYIFHHLHKYLQSYLILQTLQNSTKFMNLKEKYMLTVMRKEIETHIERKNNGREKVVFKNVMEFYGLFSNMKSKLLTMLGQYGDFFAELQTHTIDLDLLLKRARNIMVLRNDVFDGTKKLLDISPSNRELQQILRTYQTLQIIDKNTLKQYERKYTENNPQIQSTILTVKDSRRQALDTFDPNTCIIFVSLSDKKIGALVKASPNISKVFGYNQSEISFLNLNNLMPLPFAQVHENYLRKFVIRENSDKLDRFLYDLYGLDKEGYIFSTEVYLKIEPIENDICLAGCLHKVRESKHIVLAQVDGAIVNYSKGIRHLFDIVSPPKDFVTDNINLSLFAPRLLLCFDKGAKIMDKLYDVLRSIIAAEADQRSQNFEGGKDIILEEKIYLVLPKSKAQVTSIKSKTKSVGSYSKLQATTDPLKRVLLLMKELYSSYNITNCRVYKAFVVVKNKNYDNEEIKLKVAEVTDLEETRNEQKLPVIIRNMKKYIACFLNLLENTDDIPTIQKLARYTFLDISPDRDLIKKSKVQLESKSGVSMHTLALVKQSIEMMNPTKSEKSSLRQSEESSIMRFGFPSRMSEIPHISVSQADVRNSQSETDQKIGRSDPFLSLKKIDKKEASTRMENSDIQVELRVAESDDSDNKKSSSADSGASNTRKPESPNFPKSNDTARVVMPMSRDSHHLKISKIMRPTGVENESGRDQSAYLSDYFDAKSMNVSEVSEDMDEPDRPNASMYRDDDLFFTKLTTINDKRMTTMLGDQRLNTFHDPRMVSEFENQPRTLTGHEHTQPINYTDFRAMTTENANTPYNRLTTQFNDNNTKITLVHDEKRITTVGSPRFTGQYDPLNRQKSSDEESYRGHIKKQKSIGNEHPWDHIDQEDSMNMSSANLLKRSKFSPSVTPKSSPFNRSLADHILQADKEDQIPAMQENIAAERPDGSKSQSTSTHGRVLEAAHKFQSLLRLEKTTSLHKKQQDIVEASLREETDRGRALSQSQLSSRSTPYKIDKIKNKRSLKNTKDDTNNNPNGKKRQGPSQHGASSSTTPTETIRLYKYLLLDESSSPVIKKTNIAVLFSIFVLLCIIIIFYVLLEQSLERYLFYIQTSDFPLSVAANVAIFMKSISTAILGADNMFTGLNYADMQAKSLQMMEWGYQNHRDDVQFNIVDNDIQGQAISFRYDNYPFNAWKLNADGSETLYEEPFMFAIGSLVEIMNNIQNMDMTQINVNDTSIYFLGRNYLNLYQYLGTDIGNALNNEVYGSSAKIDIKSFALTALLVCLILNFAFLCMLFPIFRYIERLQQRGLSLLATMLLTDVISHQQEFRKVKLSIESGHDIEFKKEKKVVKKEKDRMKTFRHWKKDSVSAVIFIAILAVIFGVIATYFIVNYVRIVQNNEDFVTLYSEIDIMSDAHGAFNSQYATGMTILSLYGNNSTWQNLFIANYSDVESTYADVMGEVTDFWQNLDNFLNGQTYLSDNYLQLERQLKSDDVCDYITVINMTNDMLTECKQSFQQATHDGMAQFVSRIYQEFTNEAEALNMNGFNRSTTSQIIQLVDFKGLDNLFYYGDRAYEQYIEQIRSNLNYVIGAQVNESEIFLIVGIIMVILGLIGAWLPFLGYMKREFLVVKKTYSVLPLDMILGNSYMKKWLKDNSDNAFH